MLGITAFTEASFASISRAPATFLGVQAEGIALVDSQRAPATFLGVQAEGIALVDSQSGPAAFFGVQAEGIALVDSQSGPATFFGVQAEGIALVDNQERAAFFGAQAEGIALVDSQSGPTAFLGAQAEGIALEDSQSETATFFGAQAEGGFIIDSQSGAAGFVVDQLEGFGLLETQTGIGGFVVDQVDNLTMTDSSVIDFQPVRWLRTKQTIISQYANSPAILSLLSDWTDSIDPDLSIDSFYNLMWNVDTAQGYGLDVWGRIVNISRILTVTAASVRFGFSVESGTQDWEPFNTTPFYNGIQSTENYVLSDDAYRVLILAKALANISNCAIPTYNNLLMTLFPDRGNAYVVDLGNMTYELIFEFILQPFEQAIIEQSGVFNAPTGVGTSHRISYQQYFGFEGAGTTAEPFNQGRFFSGA